MAPGIIDSKIKISFFTTGLEKFNRRMKRMNSVISRQSIAVAKMNKESLMSNKTRRAELANKIKETRVTENLGKISRNNTNMNRIAQGGFFQTLRLGERDWKGFNEQGRQFATRSGRNAARIKKMTQGMRGFRMELLGVMFFGMALNRALGGLLKTSLEWTGVTEILSTALGVLFLPIAMKILEWAIIFLDWVLSLTEAQKLWIGKIVLLGMALGGLLFVIGTLGLGVGALIAVFGSLLSPMGLVLAGIAAFAAIIAFDKLPTLLDNLGNKIDKNGPKLAAMGISGEAVTQAMTKFRELVSGMLLVIEEKKSEIEASGRSIMESLFTGVKTWLSENPLIVVGAMIGVWFGGPAGAAIGGAIGGMFGRLDLEQMDEIIQKGTEIANAILTGLLENADIIADAMDKILTVIGTWIGDNSDELAELGFKIGKGIAKGVIKGLFIGLPKGIAEKIVRGTGLDVASSLAGQDFRATKKFLTGDRSISELGQPVIPGNSTGPKTGSIQEIIIHQTNNFTGTDKQLWMSDIESALTHSTEDIRIRQ